ncbi:MAG TPA: ABC transporter ATP-binding protein [Acidobacteriaceae bacterium]|nr:ABC transporter ATP-binding protein [Acidobacteriaceae bacterium]
MCQEASRGVGQQSQQVAPAEPLPPNRGELDKSILLQVENLGKEYQCGSQPLVLFDKLNLTVRHGEMLAIVGESGSGKSTLLHLLAALDRPTSGDVYCASTWLKQLSAGQAASFRNREIGYVWQLHYLLPEFTALENAAMPLLARNEPKNTALNRARELLCEVGLEPRMHHLAGELSGGEQQRVSLARALVTQPRLLLADEPTGNLDNRTAEAVFGLLERLHTTHRLTSILVTHNMDIARRCGRTLRLHAGRLYEIRLHASGSDDVSLETQSATPETWEHPIVRTASPGGTSPERHEPRGEYV